MENLPNGAYAQNIRLEWLVPKTFNLAKDTSLGHGFWRADIKLTNRGYPNSWNRFKRNVVATALQNHDTSGDYQARCQAAETALSGLPIM
jgi:hypothetical protein